MADQNYKPPIGGIPATVLKLLLNIAGAFTKRITHIPSRQIVDGFVNGFTKLVQSLSDANPEDEKQIKAIVNELLTKGDFYEGTRTTILNNIGRVGNEHARDALMIITDQVYDIADILTDEVTDNGEQLQFVLRDFIASEQGVSFVVSFLRIAGVEESTANLIGLLVLEALRGVIAEDRAKALEALHARLVGAVAA